MIYRVEEILDKARIKKNKTQLAGSSALIELIVSARISSGISTKELASYLEISERLLADYESGHKEIPMNEIYAISNRLNIAPESVLTCLSASPSRRK